MKRLLMTFSVLILVFVLTACGDVCVGAECITGETTSGTTTDSIIKYIHIDGHAAEVEREAYILFEFEALTFVKYQIAYLSCTCRDLNLNYWNVAFVEVSKEDGSILFLSFDTASDGHYLGGMWGDSDPIPTNNKTLEDFKNDFFPWIVGKTIADFEGISIFSNDLYHETVQNTTNIAETELIDDFADSSVSTNNIIRVMKSLLGYHEKTYN